jgi:aspartyl-tRNA(Asn)/glutamyl-tRNA(Gln) amidotransferase subunit A
MKIGVRDEYFPAELDGEVRAAVQKSIDDLRESRMRDQADLAATHKVSIPTYYILATAEASSNLARYDGVRYGLRAKDAKTLSEDVSQDS